MVKHKNIVNLLTLTPSVPAKGVASIKMSGLGYKLKELAHL